MLTQSPPKKKKFINSINYFRGLAIVLIVMGHCFDLAQWQMKTNLESFVHALILNGTVYFVFISGFLYYHIFYHRFNYQKFMVKKARYVLLPYLLFSLIPILSAVFIDSSGTVLPEELQSNPLGAIIWYYATGNVIFAYWYIPMVMLLYAASPLINLIINSQKVLVAFCFLLPISLIIHRPVDNLNAVHSLIYFFPVYLLGIWSSMNHKKISAYLQDNRQKILIIVLAIALEIIQVILFQQTGNFHKSFWSITVPDVNLLQKILLCFLLMSILDNYEQQDWKTMKKTAETSFAIYFIHPFLINFLYAVMVKLNINFQGNFLTLVLATVVAVVGSMAIAMIIKAILKDKSRYVIGW